MTNHEKRDLQIIVANYLTNQDGIDRLRPPLSPMLADLMARHLAVDVCCSMAMRAIYKADQASLVMEDKVPDWALAGLLAGLKPETIDSTSKLVMVCGMDARRHAAKDEIYDLMHELFGSESAADLPRAKIYKMGRILDRNPDALLRHGKVTFTMMRDWAIRRSYSEFLRALCIRLGEWIESTPDCAYHADYVRIVQEQEEQNKNLSLSQLRARARNGAVRVFLGQYHEAMKTAPSSAKTA